MSGGLTTTLAGWDGAGEHAQLAEECLEQLGRVAAGDPAHPHLPQGDPATLAVMAQTHGMLAVVAEIRDLRVCTVETLDDLRGAVEALTPGATP